MKCTHLIWAMDKTFKTYPVMMSELLHNAACGAGYLNFFCGQCEPTVSEHILEPLSIDDLFMGTLPSVDAVKDFAAAHHAAPSDLLLLCDSDADIAAALDAQINICLFDPEHRYDSVENVQCIDSFAALFEFLGI